MKTKLTINSDKIIDPAGADSLSFRTAEILIRDRKGLRVRSGVRGGAGLHIKY